MAAAVLCGLLIALFYDIYWLFFAYKYRPRWLRAAQDLLFWLGSWCAVAALWLYATGGMMRLAVYLWLGLGIILWRVSVSRRLRRLRRRPPAPPSALLKAAPPPAPAEEGGSPAQPGARSLPQRLLAGPPAAMLGLGLGFWQVMAWLKEHGHKGCAWLAARLPKRPRATDDNETETVAPEANAPLPAKRHHKRRVKSNHNKNINL